jgi:acyl-CoA dehydrogenase
MDTMTFNQSPWMDEELTLFRDNVRKFIATEITPFEEHWDAQQHVERALWTRAGAAGLLCTDVPEEYGGARTMWSTGRKPSSPTAITAAC